uniref:Putative conserved secreted protein n=1 Tax=Lutzomyia longipalpis TaxID=7200 RepID=A0A7G3AFB3_LUTLO
MLQAVIKIFSFALLIGTATALECHSCHSKQIGDDCMWKNSSSKWSTTTCAAGETVCYIKLTRVSSNATTGIAERGCGLNMNLCKDWLEPKEDSKAAISPRIALDCYVCNTQKCNERDALGVSTRMSLNIFLLLLSLLPFVKKINF